MATAVAELGVMAPRPFRVERKSRETYDTWTLSLPPPGGGPLAPAPPPVPVPPSPRPVHDALRLRRRRGSDLGQRGAARANHPRRRPRHQGAVCLPPWDGGRR